MLPSLQPSCQSQQPARIEARLPLSTATPRPRKRPSPTCTAANSTVRSSSANFPNYPCALVHAPAPVLLVPNPARRDTAVPNPSHAPSRVRVLHHHPLVAAAAHSTRAPTTTSAARHQGAVDRRRATRTATDATPARALGPGLHPDAGLTVLVRGGAPPATSAEAQAIVAAPEATLWPPAARVRGPSLLVLAPVLARVRTTLHLHTLVAGPARGQSAEAGEAIVAMTSETAGPGRHGTDVHVPTFSMSMNASCLGSSSGQASCKKCPVYRDAMLNVYII